MKLDELFENTNHRKNHEQLNEFGRPYSRTQSAKDAVVGKVKGLFGGGDGEKGNKDVGQLANAYYKDFKYYVGTQGMAGKSMIEASILIDWLTSRGFDKSVVDVNPDDLISPKEAADYIMASARKKKKRGDRRGEPQPQPQNQNSQGPNTESGVNNKVTDIYNLIRSLSPDEKTELGRILAGN